MTAESHTYTLPTHDKNGNPLPEWVLFKLPKDEWGSLYKSSSYYYAINKEGQRLTLTAKHVHHNHSFPKGRPTHDINGQPLDLRIANMCPDDSYNISVSHDYVVSYNIGKHEAGSFAIRRIIEKNGTDTLTRVE
jgi:hypothetical protein